MSIELVFLRYAGEILSPAARRPAHSEIVTCFSSEYMWAMVNPATAAVQFRGRPVGWDRANKQKAVFGDKVNRSHFSFGLNSSAADYNWRTARERLRVSKTLTQKSQDACLNPRLFVSLKA